MLIQMTTMLTITWWPLHLNIQWGCRVCFGFVNGYLSKIREHVQSHQKKSSRERSHSSHKKDEDEDKESGSSLDGISSDKEGVNR